MNIKLLFFLTHIVGGLVVTYITVVFFFFITLILLWLYSDKQLWLSLFCVYIFFVLPISICWILYQIILEMYKKYKKNEQVIKDIVSKPVVKMMWLLLFLLLVPPVLLIYLELSFFDLSLVSQVLIYYIFIFLFYFIFWSFKFRNKQEKDVLEVVYIISALIILFTTVFTVIAKDKDDDLSIKMYLCRQYKNNIAFAKEQVKPLLCAVKCDDGFENIKPEIKCDDGASYNSKCGNNNSGRCLSITLGIPNQYFQTLSLQKYSQDYIGLFPKLESDLNLDELQLEIGNGKIQKLIDFNNQADDTDRDRKVMTKLQNDLFFWINGVKDIENKDELCESGSCGLGDSEGLRKRIEQRFKDMNCEKYGRK